MNHYSTSTYMVAGEQGLEPQQAILEIAVLPLYDSPIKYN